MYDLWNIPGFDQGEVLIKFVAVCVVSIGYCLYFLQLRNLKPIRCRSMLLSYNFHKMCELHSL